MNLFVNPKKRGIRLPKGAKDLFDVLRDTRQKPLRKAKCEYCGALAVVISHMGQEDVRWCVECRRDLKDFAARQEFKFDFDVADEGAVSRFRDEMLRRQDKFMRQRLKERNPH